jgi:hypothetical protein
VREAPADVVRRTDLGRLALGWQGSCVSVFLPTHRAGREVEQVPIRLKNLLRQATDALQARAGEVPGGGSATAVFRYPAHAHEAVAAAATGVLG